MREEANRAGELLLQLADFSDLREKTRDTINIQATVRELAEIFRTSMLEDRQIDLKVDLDAAMPPIVSDVSP